MSPLTRRQFIGAAAGFGLAANGLMLPSKALTIHSRETWADGLPPKGPLESEDVKFLIVHHSASFNGHTAADVPGILRRWFNFHTGPVPEGRGWNDIAYNFVIDSEGGIWEAREGSIAGPVAGDATGGNQGFTQLVCVIGNTNEQPATAAAHASLVATLAWLADRYAVSTSPGSEVTFVSEGSNKWPEGTQVTTPTISGHRDMSLTSCPGNSLYAYVTGDLTADVDAARNGNPPSSTSTTITPTTSSSTTSTSTSSTTTSTTTTTPFTTTTSTPTTSTMIEASSTSVPPTLTVPPTTPPSTVVVAASESPSNVGLSPLLGAIATGMVVAGAALLAWRTRRTS